MDSKGVSEVYGYILVFMMIMIAVSMVYTQVYPEIKNQQESAVFEAMEDTFIVLQDVEKLVAYDVSPSRTVSLRVEEGVVSVSPDFGWTNVSVYNGTWNNHSFRYGAIRYEVGTSSIILENGAVVECFGSGCIIVSKPNMFCVDNNVFLSMINASGKTSFSGLRLVTLENNGSSSMIYENADVWIKFDTPTKDAWVNYFSNSMCDIKFEKVDDSTVKISGVNVTISYHNVSVR